MATKVVKMCDMSVHVSSKVFAMLNPGLVKVEKSPYFHAAGSIVIVTDTEPKELTYPEGWYYAKGMFRNKHQSTTGFYDEIHMLNSKGELWRDSAKYCTLDR